MAKDYYIKASSGGSSGVPTTRTLTINGVAQDLSADRTWSVGDMLTSTYDTDVDGVVDSAERIQIVVRNSTGSTLLKGKVVYLNGATGNRPNALLAKADSEATSSKTIGVVIADIANNTDGQIAVNGTLHDLDTSAFTAGDSLWLSATTAGSYISNTPPSEPNHAVFIGYVARVHPTQGRIVLNIQNGYELDELHGVQITSVADNDILQYDSASGLWKNEVMPTIPSVTPSALTRVNDTNVTLTLGGSPTNALLQAVSLTLGWTGTLADSRIASASTWNAKEPPISAGTTSQYWRGDKSWQTLDKTAVGLGSVPNTDATNPANITQSSSYRFVSDTEKTTWNSKASSLSGNLNGVAITIGTTYAGFGVSTTNTAESTRRSVVNGGTVSGLYVRITGTMTGTCAVTLMKNGVATSMTFTIATGSAAGLYSTTSNTFSVVDGDELSVRFVQTTANSIGINNFNVIIK